MLLIIGFLFKQQIFGMRSMEVQTSRFSKYRSAVHQTKQQQKISNWGIRGSLAVVLCRTIWIAHIREIPSLEHCKGKAMPQRANWSCSSRGNRCSVHSLCYLHHKDSLCPLRLVYHGQVIKSFVAGSFCPIWHNAVHCVIICSREAQFWKSSNDATLVTRKERTFPHSTSEVI